MPTGHRPVRPDRIAVVGTGIVGRTLATALAGLGHDVVVGTRDVAATARREDVAAWLEEQDGVDLLPLDEVARGADVVVNATSGAASLDALAAVGADDLSGVVLLDVANPLDFSGGFPPTMLVADTDSLAEQLQRRFPAARVVKSLNTMAAEVMVDPASVGDGDHTVFLSGDDDEAKAVVDGLLRELGWVDVIDLGGLSTARGTELVLPLWVRLYGALGTGRMQLKVVR